MAAAKEIVEKGTKLAARELEVAPTDVTFDNGAVPRRRHRSDVSMKALIEKKWGDGAASARHQCTIDLATAFPSGAHVAEVEIDPDTGTSRIVNYIAADDCGNIINHKLVEGQLQGGLDAGHRSGVRRTHRLR